MPAVTSKTEDTVARLSLDFKNQLRSEIQPNQTLTGTPTVTDTPDSGADTLAISNISIVSDTKVEFTVSGGTEPQIYSLVVHADTSGGAKLPGCLELRIVPCPVAVVTKTPNSKFTVGLDFKDQLKKLVDPNQTLVWPPTVTPTLVSGGGTASLTISGTGFEGTVVKFTMEGGTVPQVYHVKALVDTSGGETLEGCLEVRLVTC